MTTTDQRIREALSAEDEAFLAGLDQERGMFAQIGDTLHGPMGRWTVLVYVMGVAMAGLGVWVVVRMFQAPDLRELILWTSAAWAIFVAITALKMWMFGRMNVLTLMRELKRIELRIARIEGK